jgi:hypothetical protein
MKPSLWYLLVVVNVALVLLAFFDKNVYFAIAGLSLALYLDKFLESIPLPKYFRRNVVLNVKKREVD